MQGLSALASVVIAQSGGQIVGNASIVNRGVSLARQGVNVVEALHLFGLPSRSLGARD